jgi:diketogulonate reductase-like aldo/keto reductase
VQGIQGSLSRLGLPAVDLVQFYWHNYQVPKYVATSQYLMEEVAKGTIAHLGVTNFDTIRLQQMMSGGANIVSNQVCCPPTRHWC